MHVVTGFLRLYLGFCNDFLLLRLICSDKRVGSDVFMLYNFIILNFASVEGFGLFDIVMMSLGSVETLNFMLSKGACTTNFGDWLHKAHH